MDDQGDLFTQEQLDEVISEVWQKGGEPRFWVEAGMYMLGELEELPDG